MKFESVSGAVLSGGKGERLQGQDKGLLLYQGEPMMARVADALSQAVETVFVNANRNIDRYTALGFEVITDLSDFQGRGPLSGLLSCLRYAKTSHLLISPCDTPCISANAFMSLREAAQKTPKRIVYLQDSCGKHPLHAILPVASGLDQLSVFLNSEERNNVMAFYEWFGCEAITWQYPNELLNINRNEDIKA